MRSPARAIGVKSLLRLFLAALGVVLLGCKPLRANDIQERLQLEVYINNVPANLIASFTRFSGDRIGTTINELEELGLRTKRQSLPDEIVMLEDIPTLTYEYDVKKQRIYIKVDNEFRQGKTYDLTSDSAAISRSQSGWGTVLNYDFLTTKSNIQYFNPMAFEGTSLTLDGRAFSPYGTFSQSAIARATAERHSEVIRLDTSYRYSDEERMITYRAGDAISGGLAWTRPIRVGGLQAQSNFALRPDLITMPLPSLGGTAAVPSTVDVYVNNIRTFSQDVGAGPFRLNNVPLVTGAGNAQLVIRDAAGRETKSNMPFFASTSLLAPGLMSWSVEAGFPRLSYGSSSDGYTDTPVGSATLRRGIYDWLTVESHAEGGAGVMNGGAGAAVRTGNFGLMNAAMSASTSSGNYGWQGFVSFETQIFGLNVNASSQRTFQSYDDLASATARAQLSASIGAQSVYGLFNYGSGASGYSPTGYVAPGYLSRVYQNKSTPRVFDRLNIGAPLPFDTKSSISASFIHLVSGAGEASNIVSATYARSLPFNGSVFATVFRDLGSVKNTGIFVGLSMPLSESISASAGVSSGQNGMTSNVEVIKPLGPKPGSFGWRVRDAEGATPYRSASGAYRSEYAMTQIGVSQDRGGNSASFELRGSAVSMGGGIFLSNWIDDGFAVINAGAPGLEVMQENRPVGVTDSQGRLLVPSLRSYHKNKITIDPSNLPIDAQAENTRAAVVPADRAGVLVNFAIKQDTNAALIAFIDVNGKAVPAGSSGRTQNESEFVVGYDGQAFISQLGDRNFATLETPTGVCHASFDFAPRPGEQVRISDVLCR